MTKIRRWVVGLSDVAVKAISFLHGIVGRNDRGILFGAPGHVAGHSIEVADLVVVKTAAGGQGSRQEAVLRAYGIRFGTRYAFPWFGG